MSETSFIVDFDQGVSFSHVVFKSHLHFACTVNGEASFNFAEFHAGANFHGTTFKEAPISLKQDLRIAFQIQSISRSSGTSAIVVAPSYRARDLDVSYVTSLKGANVAGLILTRVDLSRCHFAGTYNLDRLKIEGLARFARDRGFLTRRPSRRIIAEEKEWRIRHAFTRAIEPSIALRRREGESDLSPESIASIYRALRKGREDIRDEPGAADFHYGEMEMRRKAKTSPLAERFILWLYWALSGYGLRASRALIAFVALVAVSSALFHLYGFEQPDDPFAQPQIGIITGSSPSKSPWPPSLVDLRQAISSTEAWTYSLGTAIAIFSAPDAPLTRAGRRYRVVLRIIGPVLLGSPSWRCEGELSGERHASCGVGHIHQAELASVPSNTNRGAYMMLERRQGWK
jgi:hypothetical protein